MSELKTSLYDKHVELGAKMAPYAGYSMPIQYKNLKNEVKAVRENCGVFDVSHMGEFLITGPDAQKFVNEMVTNDITTAPINKAVYALLLNDNGGILDDLLVYKLGEEKMLLCVNASNTQKDLDHLKKYTSNYNIEFKDLTQDYSLLAVQGPKAFEILKKTSFGKSIEDIPYFSIQQFGEKDLPEFIARTGYTGEDGFEVFSDHETIGTLFDELINLGVEPCGLGSRDVLRLEVCFPLYGNDLSEEVTPLDVGLKWAVKLNKDHFIGKEFLETYSPKQKLIKLSLDKGIPRQGYKVINSNDNEVGVITSGTLSPTLEKGIAFASVTLENSDENFFIDIRGKKYEANVVKKSFIMGGHK